ncbi:MAG: hypothetical protein EA356_06675 [Geminicoccaceae bacterium]|nr:MAG: hypothetical protein EA356_06675 [Geminicoccaceae bacterium]
MAHEIRYIAFNRREVGEMVRHFAAIRLDRAIDGVVIDIVKEDRDVLITFEDDNQRQSSVRLNEGDSLVCMLAFCQKRRFPVAQRFVKHVEVTGNALVLAMRGTAQPINPTMGGR